MSQLIKIPELFYHSTIGTMHNTCVLCDDDLLSYEFGYVIEKAFLRNKATGYFETVFEYAICKECQQKLSGEMSQESLLNIQRYFIQNALQTEQFSDLFPDADSRMKLCMVKGVPVSDMNEYQVGGQFKKDKMLVSDTFPYALGETAISEIQDLLSEKTKGFTNKFKELVLPPDVKNNVPENRFIFL
jgi:hypothetical protein